MALDYTGVDNGLFTHLGKYIQYFNSYLADANNSTTGLDADRRVILDALNKGPQFVAVEGVTGDYESWKEQIAQRRAALAQFMTARLQDPSSVLNEIGAVSTDITEILTKLIIKMRDDSKFVQESTATLTSVTSVSGNSGNGKIVPTLMLDGVSSPGSWNGLQFPPMLDYFTRNTQLVVPDEKMTLRCIDGGSGSGIASFIWEGKYPDPQGQFGLNAGGSGQIAIISDIHQDTESVIKNPDFETLTAPNTIPDDWTAISGSVANITQNIILTDVSHGSASLRFASTGTGGTAGVEQSIDPSTLTNCRRYMVSAQVKADSSSPGSIEISLTGNGFSASQTLTLSGAPSGFNTVSFFFNAPKVIPNDLKFAIKWTGITTALKNVYIDDIGLGPVTYGGGIGLAITRGSTPFALGDRFYFTVGCSPRGIFQTAFRDVYGVQLPSSNTPNISDSLAESSSSSSGI